MRYLKACLFVALFVLFTQSTVHAGEAVISYDRGVLNGLEEVRAVFDVRTKSPKALLFILKVIEQTKKEMTENRATPHFVLSFRGGTLPLLVAKPKVENDADRAILQEVRERLQRINNGGSRLEACNVAAGIFKVQKKDLADSLTMVSNSLVSLIAYQNKGYALVPMY